jgi:hypothetical protein
MKIADLPSPRSHEILVFPRTHSEAATTTQRRHDSPNRRSRRSNSASAASALAGPKCGSAEIGYGGYAG